MYVRITSEAPAALILAAPDPWAEPVAVLELGQELRVLDPSSGTYVRVRTVGMGFDAEGWVWRPAVGKKKPADNADTREEWQREGATSAARDTGQPTVNPSELEAALQRLGNFEQSRADVSGGAAELVRRFRRFGEVGGLSDD